MSMRIKATLAIMSIVIVFTAASFFLSLSFTQQHMTVTIEQELYLALDIADTAVTTKINLLESNAETVITVLNATRDEDLANVMAGELKEFNDFVALTVYDHSGIVAYSGQLVSCSDMEFMQSVFDGESRISTAYYDDSNGAFIMDIFVPMGNGRVLSMTLPGLYFSDILSGYHLWQTGSIFIVDKDGTFIASARSDLVLEQRNFIEEAKTDPELKSAGEFYQTMITSEKDSGRYTFDGTERLCVYKHVSFSGAGWYIGLTAPLSESPITDVQYGLLWSALFLLVTGALVSIVVSGYVIRPFKTIEKQAAQIGADHERTTLILDTMPQSCCLLDKGSNIFRCNEGTVRLFELSNREEFINNFYKFSPQYQPDGQLSIVSATAYIDKAFEDGECVFEWMHQKKNGELIPTEVRLIRIIYDGEPVLAAYARDLREQKKMIQDIERRDELLKAQVVKIREAHDRAMVIIDKTPFACHLCNRDYEVFDCNDENLQLFKVADKNDLINNFRNFLPEYQPDGQLSLEVARAQLKKAFSVGKIVYDEFVHLAADGTRIPAEITLVRVPFDDDFVVAVYLRDLREHKQMMLNIQETSKQLEIALDDATKANEAKTSFLANMSHEMRTPLNAIIGLTDLTLGNGRLDEASYSNLEKINSAGMSLLSTVNDILDISKIEAGKFELTPAVYDIPSLINDTVTQSITHKQEKPIVFNLKIDGGLPAQLYGDELRIKQVLNNLLSNAFKYTKEGTVELGIYCENITNDRAGLSADNTGPHNNGGGAYGGVMLVGYVKDTGIGISKEYVARVFDDYAQMDAQANRKIMGTGLGLSITKRLIEMMNGTISVESEFGKGSIFTVRLPQGFISDDVIGPDMVENLKKFHYFEQKRKQDAKLARISLPYARVLVVDDVQTNLDVARGLMKPYGMQIDCVTSGVEAINAIREENVRYNAVFMDHMMPVMDGIEATRRIREIGTHYAENIPIIALTANAITGSEEMFMNKGFQAFISKPIELLRLDAVIRQWVRDKEQEKLYFDRQVSVDGNIIPDTRSGCERRARSNRRSGLDRRALGRLYFKLDYAKGLERFSGSEPVYQGVLRSYAVNTRPLLSSIKDVTSENLADYAITIHGLKGSSRAIFADAVGDKAEALEKAAKAGDFDYISSNNQLFITAVEELLADLDAMFMKIDKEVRKPEKDKADKETLVKLLAVCKNYDMDGADEIIKELEQYKYDTDGSLITYLREAIDEADFTRIIEKLSYLET